MGLSLVLVAIVVVGGGMVYLARDLPDVRSLKNYVPAQATRVYSDDGQVIGQFYIEQRIFVPLAQMPKYLIQAALAVEDARFYEHAGFDWIRIIKATLINLESARIKQGASTITQQLVRSLFLTPERTLRRKLKELLLARRMEVLFTKDEILEIYLNHVYFGEGAYGVGVAAQTYFGRPVSKISLGEAAFLAGLLKAPTTYSPYLGGHKAKERQGIVLKRMRSEKFITDKQYQNAYRQDLRFVRPPSGNALAPHFLEHLRQELIFRYGYDRVYRGGLRVETTLNIALQQAVNRALDEGLRALDKRQGYRGAISKRKPGEVSPLLRPGAVTEGRVISVSKDSAIVEVAGSMGKMPLAEMLWARKRYTNRTQTEFLDFPQASDLVKTGDRIHVRVLSQHHDKDVRFSLEQAPLVEGAVAVFDPHTGAIKAMVGGNDFKSSKFDRVFLARRQPGSAFKPMIYATALERGLTPATLVIDNPIIYHNRALGRVWKPENYDGKFYGPTRLREALTFSRNLATIRLLERIGVRSVMTFSERIGIRSRMSRNLSLALGTSEVSLMELTAAYGVFASGGLRTEPMMIRSVRDATGRVLEQHHAVPKRVISRETAYLITHMMEDVIARGTARKARVLGNGLAGKTGTTNAFTDAWFIGYSSRLVVGTWVGFDDRRPLGEKETGAQAALPIWIQVMQDALHRFPAKPFHAPDQIVYARINPVSGLRVDHDDAQAILEVFAKGTVPPIEQPDEAQPAEFMELDAEPF